jgi:hypothetical protein
MSLRLAERVARLEAFSRTTPVRLTPAQTADAARRYEATLYEPREPTPRQADYYASRSLHEMASDYDAMLKDAPAPWE